MTDEKQNTEDFDVIIPEKGLHRPARVQVRGVTYESVVMSSDVIGKIDALQKEVQAGNLNAMRDQLLIVFQIPKKVLVDMDQRDLGVIAGVATKMMMESELYRTDIEKNVEGPGETNSS